jgi:HD superfamily phosphohydrolase
MYDLNCRAPTQHASRETLVSRDAVVPPCRDGLLAVVKVHHEIRDAIHGFVVVSSQERTVVDSRPLQRLRHIAQLAMSPLVYPGATHRRFEHSLGVMHLAGEVFDVLTNEEHLTDWVKEYVPELNDLNRPYWRTVVRMAALCHDIGHIPFSHAAEHELLPDGVTHETLTAALIRSEEMAALFESLQPAPKVELVAKLAVGPTKDSGQFSVWEAVLSEIITGDAFGVDRMYYLLRDSHHAGVTYGRFDQLRLLQSLRLLPPSEDSETPVIGIEEGGLSAAEAMLLARYFMFGQVYFHHIRVIYDIHLIDFLRQSLPGGMYGSSLEDRLQVTDNEIWADMATAARDANASGHDPAERIINRRHFKLLYRRRAIDVDIFDRPGEAVAAWAVDRFGSDAVRYKMPHKAGGALDFPVRDLDGSVSSSALVSETLKILPPNTTELVYVHPDQIKAAKKLLSAEQLRSILQSAYDASAEEQLQDDNQTFQDAQLGKEPAE